MKITLTNQIDNDREFQFWVNDNNKIVIFASDNDNDIYTQSIGAFDPDEFLSMVEILKGYFNPETSLDRAIKNSDNG